MNQPHFHPKARGELEKSALFYDGKFPGLGLEFATEVQAAVDFAFAHPEAGMPVSNGFRRVSRPPVSIFNRISHQRRFSLYHRSSPPAAAPELLE